MAHDEIGGAVGRYGFTVAPVPQLPQDCETATVEFVSAFDTPDLVGIDRLQAGALLDQPCATLFLPGEPRLFL